MHRPPSRLGAGALDTILRRRAALTLENLALRQQLRSSGGVARTTPKMAARMDVETSRIWSRNDRGSILVESQERKLAWRMRYSTETGAEVPDTQSGGAEGASRESRRRDTMKQLDIDKLRAEFNRASESVRIVSVFSPT